MNKELILVVEDEAAIRNLIAMTLETHDYKYMSVTNGKEALEIISEYKPSMILLDLGLPDIDGIEIIKKTRSWSNMPIIVISARSDDNDKILALDEGADDYLTKPFSVEELLARIRASLRRIHSVVGITLEESSIFINGDLKIDYVKGSAYIKEEELHLTPIEYKLLCLLAQNIGKVLTLNYITKNVWGSGWDNDVASLRVFMVYLRKKLEGNTNDKYIQTHVGVGYRMLKI
ncbi:MAG: response regulator transcription factor [Erysipelotrichaceae bacterium]